MGGAVDVDEGVPPPWIRMVKKSSFANPEDDGVAPPWVRMVRKRQAWTSSSSEVSGRVDDVDA